MVARFGFSFLSKTMDEMRAINEQEPDTPVKARLALCGLVVGLNLQSLERPKRGADRLHFPGIHLLLTIGELQFQAEVTQHVEAIVELVADGEAQVDAFFDGGFRTVGSRSFSGGIVDHGFGDGWRLMSRRHWGRPARCCCGGRNGRRW